MISATVIADSIGPNNKRLTTVCARYHRYIHSELMTHRMLSRNASSSRAIPVKKMIMQVVKDPAIPVHWGANQAGMQAHQQLSGWRRWLARRLWLLARWPAVLFVLLLMLVGLHKQVANRILEPWMWITVLISATEWGNFFNLRYHPDAQPEFRRLAEVIWEAMQRSHPIYRRSGVNDTAFWKQYHTPYVSDEEAEALVKEHHQWDLPLKVSAARCARVSYLTHEGKKPTLQEDLDLFNRLMGGVPKHASPTEHQAIAGWNETDGILSSGNFFGWTQFRKTIKDENLPQFRGPGYGS